MAKSKEADGKAKAEKPGSAAAGKSDDGRAVDDVDALFQLPLAEFTAARNALAARLKKAGHGDQAEQIKALLKPSTSAWVANQLYWKHRGAFDRLMATGERFRGAQAAQLEGKNADLRGPLEARREALSELSRLAASTLRDAGGSATPDTMRRITTTLEALSTYGAQPNGPRPGRLSDDVDPPGFETLAALVPRVDRSGPAEGSSRVIPFQPSARAARAKKPRADDERAQEEARKAQMAAAKAAVQEAERSLREARAAAHEAEAALKKAAAQAKATDKEKQEAEQRLERAAAAADEARQHARAVAAEAENAAQAVEDAERALAKARGALEEL